MRLVLVVFAMWLTGCAPGIGVFVDANEPAALVEAVESAVERWNAELGADVFDVVVSEHPRAGYLGLGSVVVSTCDAPAGGDNADTLTLGVASHIRIRTGAVTEFPELLEWLVMHELGHSMGLRHSNDRGNLMFADPWEGEESFHVSPKQRRRARVAAALESSL